MKESRCFCRALCGLLLVRVILGQSQPANSDLCLLCLDGSTPLETEDLLDESRFGSGVSCASLLAGTGGLLGCDSEELFVLQLTLIQANCCPNGSRSPCTLCPDVSSDIAFPSRSLPSPSEKLVDISCSDLVDNETVQAEFLADFVGDPGVCENTLVRRSAGYCGCPTITPECDLCTGGDLIPDEEFALTKTPCSEIAFEVSLLPQGQCQQASNDYLVGFDTAALCCENVGRPNQCNLCSIQEQLVPVRAVTTEAYGEVTCAELQDAATLTTTSAACQSLQGESGGICCVQRPDGNICELTCPDGSAPPDPFKRDPVTGHSCQDLAREYAKFSVDECDKVAISSAISFDAVAFCCPKVDPPDECLLCPQGKELLYPERVLFAYEGHSCSAVSESLRHVIGDTTCQSIMDDSRAERNCQCRTEIPPTQSPGRMPTPNGAEGSGTTGRPAGQPLQATLLAGLFCFAWML
jgi:hypothetical protein